MPRVTTKGVNWKRGNLGFWQPPPEGLVPIGDTGIYVSPHVKEDKPVSPFNCEAWPDSPYCGGMPFTREPIGVDLGFTANECGVSITWKPKFAFINLPEASIAWIAPNCRGSYPSQPTPAQVPGLPDPNSFPDLFFPDADDDAYVLMVLSYNQIGTSRQSSFDNRGNFVKFDFRSGIGQHRYYKAIRENRPSINSSGRQDTLQWTIEGAFEKWDYYDEATVWALHAINPHTSLIWTNDLNFKFPGVEVWQGTRNANYYGRYRDIKNLKKSDGTSYWQKSISSYSQIHEGKLIQEGVGAVYFTLLHFEVVIGRNNAYPPPPQSPRKCCMKCCTDNLQRERKRDQDNAEILKLLKEIKSAVGVDEFPVKLPASLITKDEGFIGNLIPNPPVQEKNIPSLIARFIRYFDEINGQWEIPIEIKDTDPLKPGDQPKGIKLHNLAEAIADIYAMLFDSYLINQQILHLGSKNLIETGMTKQNVVQNYYALLCLIDFFGFKYKEIDVDLPLSFKPGESKFEDFIKDAVQRIKVFDLDVNDKSVVTYKDDIFVLKRAAQIIEAVYFRKLDHKSDMKRQIIEFVKLASQYTGKVRDGEIDPSGGKTEEFEKWLEDAESEFSRKTGVNTQNPYGRPYDQRPRLTILDVDNPTQD